MLINDALSKLENVNGSNGQYTALCPSHDDTNPSLSIKEGDNGQAIFYCHAGCTADAVMQAIGVKPVKNKSKTVEEYNYEDENGALLYQAVRLEPKSFRQRRPSGNSWIWNNKGIRKVPYRLAKVIKAVSEDKTIFIVEGEKDVHTLEHLGLTSTCNAGGAGKWLPEFAQFFKNATVVILPDNDQPGREHANKVAQTLQGSASSVKILNLPGLKEKGDVTDWLNDEGSIEQLRELYNNTDDVTSVPAGFRLISAADLIKNTTSVSWLIKQIIEVDCLLSFFGAPGAKKSFCAIDMGLCIATGKDWHGKKVTQGAVVYIAGEGHNGIARRLKAWEIHNQLSLENIPFYISEHAAQLFDEVSAKSVSEAVDSIVERTKQSPKLIIIDTLARNFGPANENSTEDMNKFIDHIDKYLRKPYQACVLIIHHTGHMDQGRARGSSVFKAAIDAEYKVEQRDGYICLVNTKMKDAEAPETMYFEPIKVKLPMTDEDGTSLTSLALQFTDNVQFTAANTKGLGKNQQAMYDLLNEMYSDYRANLEGGGNNPDNAKVEFRHWKDEGVKRNLLSPDGNKLKNEFYKVKKSLTDRKLIHIEGPFVFLAGNQTVT